MRARGYEVVLPSADMANYHQFMPSNRYADMVLQRVLVDLSSVQILPFLMPLIQFK